MPLVCIDSGIACMSILILVSFSLLFLLSYSWGCCRAVAPMIIVMCLHEGHKCCRRDGWKKVGDMSGGESEILRPDMILPNNDSEIISSGLLW
jgi:hypothetical protein